MLLYYLITLGAPASESAQASAAATPTGAARAAGGPDEAEQEQPGEGAAASPPQKGGKGPPKKGGKAGKGPPLPGTAGDSCAGPASAEAAAPSPDGDLGSGELQRDIAEHEQPEEGTAAGPPQKGGKGPPKKGGKAGKGPPLPGTAGESCAGPASAEAMAPSPDGDPGSGELQRDIAEQEQPGEGTAASPPQKGAKGPPKKGGKVGKGPPLPETADDSCAAPAAAEAAPAAGITAPSAAAATPAAEAKAGAKPKGPFAKKGKGPPPPGPPGKGPDLPQEEAPGAQATGELASADTEAAAKTKGPPKKGGKGPPPPGPKAAPEETAEQAEQAPKTKGPPKKGGKGPPLPTQAEGPAAPQEEETSAPSSGKGKGPKGPAGPGKGPGKGPPGKGPGPAGKGKGKGKEPLQLRQPKIKPKQNMKQLWWSRFLFGKHLKEGEGVWDEADKENVQLASPVIHLMENRFGRGAAAAVKAAPKPAASDGPKEAPKAIRIITDPNLIVGKEAAMRTLPPAEEVATALLKLDAVVLSPSQLSVIKEHASPQPAQVSQLEECRKEHPTVPFALPEEYMWQISRVPAFQARISCWTFVLSYKETASACSAMLGEFQLIEDAVRQSRSLRQLLALILQVGNYLNGSTDRGQADGFDLETLGKLDSVKDNARTLVLLTAMLIFELAIQNIGNDSYGCHGGMADALFLK
ncbi:FMN2 [Symbiodinium natans]|uniref:FMN2 protein n=1 Tax=Symbiodinium natans TaxID=878477 RepID=A0A812SSI5_9DINO|nr:FMN2 [Symbiodinium natans]